MMVTTLAASVLPPVAGSRTPLAVSSAQVAPKRNGQSGGSAAVTMLPATSAAGAGGPPARWLPPQPTASTMSQVSMRTGTAYLILPPVRKSYR